MDKEKIQAVINEIGFLKARIRLIQETTKEKIKPTVPEPQRARIVTRRTNNALRELMYIEHDLKYLLENGAWPETIDEIKEKSRSPLLWQAPKDLEGDEC